MAGSSFRKKSSPPLARGGTSHYKPLSAAGGVRFRNPSTVVAKVATRCRVGLPPCNPVNPEAILSETAGANANSLFPFRHFRQPAIGEEHSVVCIIHAQPFSGRAAPVKPIAGIGACIDGEVRFGPARRGDTRGTGQVSFLGLGCRAGFPCCPGGTGEPFRNLRLKALFGVVPWQVPARIRAGNRPSPPEQVSICSGRA